MFKLLVTLGVSTLLVAANAFASEPLKIVMVGDSTMAPKLDKKRPETGWGEALDSLFEENVTVVNLAVNGRSTKSFIDEGRWDQALSELREGDFLLVEFGHNDEKSKDPSRYAAPWGAYSENLRRFVKEARANGAEVVLMSPICRRKFDGDLLRDTHGDYPAAAKSVSEELDVSYVDMEKRTRYLLGVLGPDLSKSLFLHLEPAESPNYPDGVTDDTHLNAQGAAVHAKLFVKALQEQGHPLTEYLR